MSDPLRLLSDEGVAVWLDDMSRERLISGNLKALVRGKHIVGVTIPWTPCGKSAMTVATSGTSRPSYSR